MYIVGKVPLEYSSDKHTPMGRDFHCPFGYYQEKVDYTNKTNALQGLDQ